jgi:hypothetical protein
MDVSMNFRTEIKIEESSVKIEHSDKILTIGSCFAENIAGQFKYYLFDVFENPFGVLYNPVSIYNAFNIIGEEKRFTREDLIYHQNEWHSFYHHSDFSRSEADECLNVINTRSEEVKNYLSGCKWVIISLGTSNIYKHKEREITVSNCHKIPADRFERISLSVEESIKYLSDTAAVLRRFNAGVKIIFTVSPVRHIKDGFVENQLSKSALTVAVHRLVKQNSGCFYFPAFEILMDDLRDYRFYEKDMLHPNKLAVEYIWEKFSECYFSNKCAEAVKEIEPFVKGKNHRLRDAETPQAKKFLTDLQKMKEDLLKKYPYLVFRD